MAQPEHTRNDQHLTNSQLLLSNGTSPSIWETWGAENLVDVRDPRTGQMIRQAVVDYGGYPIVVLPTFKSYFSTPGLSIRDRKGVADFSNRNFVTQDTNYNDQATTGRCRATRSRCLEYEHPRLDQPGTSLRIEPTMERVIDDLGQPRTVLVDEAVYSSLVYDAYTGTTDLDPFHTFHSLLDQETRRYGCPTFSLGDGSYLSRASLLVPRAVGYSAGVIEHFFRGSISASFARQWDGSYDLTLTNLSADPIGADAHVVAAFRPGAGYFDATSDDLGIIRGGPISEMVPGFAGLPPTQTVTIRGLQPPGLRDEDELTDFETRVVVGGTLGNSPDEIIGIVIPPAPSADLKVEISWGGAAPPRGIAVSNGRSSLVWSATDRGYRYCSPSNTAIPGVCIASPVGGFEPVEVTIDHLDPSAVYSFQLMGDSFRSTYQMVTKFTLNGVLVRTQTAIVSTSATTDVVFASYP